jgi:hypothetical protein
MVLKVAWTDALSRFQGRTSTRRQRALTQRSGLTDFVKFGSQLDQYRKTLPSSCAVAIHQGLQLLCPPHRGTRTGTSAAERARQACQAGASGAAGAPGPQGGGRLRRCNGAPGREPCQWRDSDSAQALPGLSRL